MFKEFALPDVSMSACGSESGYEVCFFCWCYFPVVRERVAEDVVEIFFLRDKVDVIVLLKCLDDVVVEGDVCVRDVSCYGKRE